MLSMFHETRVVLFTHCIPAVLKGVWHIVVAQEISQGMNFSDFVLLAISETMHGHRVKVMYRSETIEKDPAHIPGMY